ncbi:hypothetical protein OAH30_05335 [Candidatus Pelagibacter sp.]|nr:hypothetical protein [Candidatus Pelagibacter sp.]
MKNRLLSILVSLVFLPIAVLTQYIGFYFGKILYFIYENIMFLNMPQFLINIAPLVISGFLAGYIAAKAVQLIYKNYNVNFCLIIPAIIIIISLLGTLLNAESSKDLSEIIGTVLREIVTFGLYLFTLKNMRERI